MLPHAAFFLSLNPRHTASPLFPYTTLFRSCGTVSAKGKDAFPMWRFLSRQNNCNHPRLMKVSTKCTDRKSTRLNSSHTVSSYAVFCLKKKKYQHHPCLQYCYR